MKADEAPEKLYLISDEDDVVLSLDNTKVLRGDRFDFLSEIAFPIKEGTFEYIRTDVFIEKAEKYLKSKFIKDVSVLARGVVDINFSTAIENFVNYMKGE